MPLTLKSVENIIMAAPLSRRIFSPHHCFWCSIKQTISARSSTSSDNIFNISRNFASSKLVHDEARSSSKTHGETHFGFQSVAEEEKENKVYEVFEKVSSKYDVMNDAMSAGVHRIWKDYFLQKFSPSPGTKLLDVAGGTGDIAFRFLRHVGTPSFTDNVEDIEIPVDVTAQVYMDPREAPFTSSSSSSSDEETDRFNQQDKDNNYATPPDAQGNHVTICDINQAMLDEGKKKAKCIGYTNGITWMRGNAEKLDLPDNTFDAYTIAFGIRNCTHVQEVLNEAYRVLKPGGRFMCLEFSEVKNPLLRSAYDTYSFQVIPVMGQLIAGDWKSYQYLVESIRQFPNQEDFAAMIKAAGFRMVTYENLTFGVAAIHSGYKI